MAFAARLRSSRPAGLERHYRREGEQAIVPLRVLAVRDLFSRLDPSPVRAKDLDDGVEEYIVAAAEELPKRSLKLVIQLPDDSPELMRGGEVQAALQNYFQYRRESAHRQLRALLADGRRSLVIGLSFLTTCLVLREVFVGQVWEGAARHIFEEGLLVMAWVAMWRPIHLHLYDWWPVLRRRRLYERLTRLAVELRSAGAGLL